VVLNDCVGEATRMRDRAAKKMGEYSSERLAKAAGGVDDGWPRERPTWSASHLGQLPLGAILPFSRLV